MGLILWVSIFSIYFFIKKQCQVKGNYFAFLRLNTLVLVTAQSRCNRSHCVSLKVTVIRHCHSILSMWLSSQLRTLPCGINLTQCKANCLLQEHILVKNIHTQHSLPECLGSGHGKSGTLSAWSTRSPTPVLTSLPDFYFDMCQRHRFWRKKILTKFRSS